MTQRHYDGDGAGTTAASDISDTVCDIPLFRIVGVQSTMAAGSMCCEHRQRLAIGRVDEALPSAPRRIQYLECLLRLSPALPAKP
ncbi:hypothetical protein [Nocardia sp. AB354]|uniref:hypothetical protein n=1 Tax=Nocardia sp. AB354 TaxID=3413283 RepID=UPI003C24E826